MNLKIIMLLAPRSLTQIWSDTETQRCTKELRGRKSETANWSTCSQTCPSSSDAAANDVWRQWTGRQVERIGMRDKNKSWQLLHLTQIMTKLLGQPQPKTHSHTFSFSVTQPFIEALVSCGRWRQINTSGNNGWLWEEHLLFYFKGKTCSWAPYWHWEYRGGDLSGYRWQRDSGPIGLGLDKKSLRTNSEQQKADNTTISESVLGCILNFCNQELKRQNFCYTETPLVKSDYLKQLYRNLSH